MSRALGANGLSILPCGVRHLLLDGANGAGKVGGGGGVEGGVKGIGEEELQV